MENGLVVSPEAANELRDKNDKIVTFIVQLKEQRNELAYIIEKQQEEVEKLQTEVERLTYKITLISKSLAQRIKAKNNYDKTINQVESNYIKLVQNSSQLLNNVVEEVKELEQIMDKQTNTDDKLKKTEECKEVDELHKLKPRSISKRLETLRPGSTKAVSKPRSSPINETQGDGKGYGFDELPQKLQSHGFGNTEEFCASPRSFKRTS